MKRPMEQGDKRKEASIVILIVCLTGFLMILTFRGAFSGINNAVNLWFVTVHNNAFTAVAIVVANGFDTTSLLPLSFVVGAVFFVVKKRRYALLLVGGMSVDAAVLLVLKTLIYSPRPLNGLVVEASNSFPSGHTTSTVILFGFFTFIAWQTWKSRTAKIVSGALYLTIVSLVGITRLYLDVHWLTDVIGGYFLGSFLAVLCISLLPYVIRLYEEKIGKLRERKPQKTGSLKETVYNHPFERTVSQTLEV